MISCLELGSTPSEENCAQLGEEDYERRAKKECRVYINQLRRQFGKEPEGAEFKIKAFSHDFGWYYEAVCIFDEDKEGSIDYAYKCCNEGPEHWDMESLEELKE